MNDGGPAFPVECSHDDTGKIVGIQTGNRSGFEIGMTLRDYFAAKAMSSVSVGILARLDDDTISKHPTTAAEILASTSYAIADAMLAARKGNA